MLGEPLVDEHHEFAALVMVEADGKAARVQEPANHLVCVGVVRDELFEAEC